jgi:hypothetical protein
VSKFVTKSVCNNCGSVVLVEGAVVEAHVHMKSELGVGTYRCGNYLPESVYVEVSSKSGLMTDGNHAWVIPNE